MQRHGLIAIADTLCGPYKMQKPTWAYPSANRPTIDSIYPRRTSIPDPEITNPTFDWEEDPHIWRSGGTYHVLYSGSGDRVGWHLYSPDGINNWKDNGLAFDPRMYTKIFGYEGSTTYTKWYKMERPGVVLEDGHPTHITWAVADVDKDNMIPAGSNHGSKMIVVPFDGVAFDADFGSGGGRGGGVAGGARGRAARRDGWRERGRAARRGREAERGAEPERRGRRGGNGRNGGRGQWGRVRFWRVHGLRRAPAAAAAMQRRAARQAAAASRRPAASAWAAPRAAPRARAVRAQPAALSRRAERRRPEARPVRAAAARRREDRARLAEEARRARTQARTRMGRPVVRATSARERATASLGRGCCSGCWAC